MSDKTCNCGVKKSCGRKGKVQGGCVEIDITLPDKSTYSEAECKPNANEAVSELYELVCANTIDLSLLKDSCLDYFADCENPTWQEVVIAQDALLQEYFKSQEEETETEGEETPSLTLSDIDTSEIETLCLQDECENGLGTGEKLIQSLVTLLCQKCEEIADLSERVALLEANAIGEEVVIPQARVTPTTKTGFLGTPKNT